MAAIGIMLSAPGTARGQAADGHLVGSVVDQSGASIPSCIVSVENVATGVSWNQEADEFGAYRFNNLPVGDYTLSAKSVGFAPKMLSGIAVALNRTSTANVTLELGEVQTTVEVTAASAQIDTTTSTVGGSFDSRQALYSPSSDLALGVLNLSLQGAGVASSGGTGLGEGPSIGGQRPRNNNFMVEGVDNTDKGVTGRLVDVPNEAVAEFSVLQNQYGAEFGRSTGGQFNTVVKSGTNEIHGSLYEYFANRALNAMDQSNKRRGITEKPRLDDNRFGGTVGGPVVRNRLFYFGTYERNPVGQASAPGRPFSSPTAEGFATLDRIQGLSSTNRQVLKRYVPPAPAATGSTIVLGEEVPIGVLPINVPTYQNNMSWLASADYNRKSGDQLRFRNIRNSSDAIDPGTSPDLPTFTSKSILSRNLATLSYFRTLSSELFNETRLGFSRSFHNLPAGDFEFPGLDSFPNITIEQDLDIQIGPYEVAPQSGAQNTYQLVNNTTFINGRHTLKFGFDARRNITSDLFVQRQRGDYNYSTLERFLLDLSPDIQAERNTGGGIYHGNNTEFYSYVSSETKVRRNLTLTLGLRHEYKGIPYGDTLQALNAVSSVPGVLTFGAPKAQKRNFAPRAGLAFSPGSDGRTVVRAGFGVAYDAYFTNLGQLQKPPQLENTFRGDPTVDTPNYLANGGIRPDQRPDELDEDSARALTSTYIPDQHLPYSLQWNFGIERVVARDYTLSARYLGTRGVRLFTQSVLPLVARATPQLSLPTFYQRPAQSELDGLTVTLADIDARPNSLPQYADNGFSPFIFAFPNRGNSIYHGLATEVRRRFSNGLQFIGAYTWSKNIDDSTADLFSTLLSPRRPQDFQDMRAERARSFLDRTHRLTMAWVYEVPFYRNSSGWLRRNLLGNWVVSGMFTAESPQYATVQSGLDSNRNLDGATDRVVVNPGGVDRTGSDVTALTNSAGEVVGYLADNPNARYVKAGPGVHPNGGRNTLPLRGINNFDFSVSKRFSVGEHKAVEFRAAFYNALNHPQYTPGSLNSVRAVASRDTRNNLIPGHPVFDRPDQVYNSHAREIRLVLRFTF
ncbi:MAG: carboxypeptidase-like regulatory domain-containing protein [Bryobacterales bacterium]|nr:carboxypeptidase-like regulatory domain-containing protein [Bryobacterales bacterium]